jgi:hypothetical protein
MSAGLTGTFILGVAENTDAWRMHEARRLLSGG